MKNPIKVITDFGIRELTPKKVFTHAGYTFAIIDKPEQYMNAESELIMRRVVEYTTGATMPVYNMQSGETLKVTEQRTRDSVDSFVKRGAVLADEVAKFETLNTI